jgi:hypothetical protein
MSRKAQAIIVIVLLLLVIALITILWIKRSKPREKATVYQPPLVCTRLEEQRFVDRQPSVVPAYKWAWTSNQTLLVHFDARNEVLRKRVIAVANEWAKFCGMAFQDTVNRSMAQIRVTFEGKQYASAVGRECFSPLYAGRPTMYLGGLDTMRDERNFRRIVLHEFGHALGLEHELRNPRLQIPWDTAAVIKYYRDHYRWDKAKVYKNILTPLDVAKGKRYDEFDSSSIMIYAVPDTLTKGRMKIEWTYELSLTDKKGIGKWYPKNVHN